MAEIYAVRATIGQDVTIESDIGTPDNHVQDLVLGDGVYIGSGCNIQVPSLTVLDFTKIHRNCLLYGRNPLRIGHNCWFGEGTIIDAEGHTTIEDNVGVGAHSQLWSHIRHGDLLQGCQFYNFGNLTIHHDAWLVGHCIVSPVEIFPFAVALVGSVVTRDMYSHKVYGGSPAKDLTDKLGPPYIGKASTAKLAMMQRKLEEFQGNTQRFVACEEFPEAMSMLHTYLSVKYRTYTKRGTPEERALMRFLLPEFKFTPEG